MDENMKIELKPQFDYESECKSVELEIINPKNLVDARLDEIDNQIADLDISIDKVENGMADYRQRIVFVNKSGDFVNLFECNIDEVYIENKGVVIYPETVIKRESSEANPLKINFETSEQYGS